jgi:hypothetical protein
MTWTQSGHPLGNLLLSALVAAIPVVVLPGAPAFFHVEATGPRSWAVRRRGAGRAAGPGQGPERRNRGGLRP